MKLINNLTKPYNELDVAILEGHVSRGNYDAIFYIIQELSFKYDIIIDCNQIILCDKS